MSLTMTNISKGGVLLLLVAGLLCSCAEERDPIDRVQPYALPKSFFIGEDYQLVDDDPEFWTQNSLVDVGYGASRSGIFTSTSAQPMARIKWQITEDYLIGRAAYERIIGSDGKGIATGFETQDGIIVASFRIEKQFDVVNAYNSTTGEKMNIVEENSYDRPWYDRDYIRVDFSKNLNTGSYDFDTLSLLGVYGGIQWDPMSYYVEDPNDEDAPVFDVENGYFDITTKVLANPGVIDISHLGWGLKQIPACWLDPDFFGGPGKVANCNPVEVTLRHSFRRVENKDFQPIDYDGWRFQAFGGFSWTERLGYARNYGMTDSLHYRFLSKQNIWERHHYYEDPEQMSGAIECFTPDTTKYGEDPNRDVMGRTDADGTNLPNGTADECEEVTEILGIAGSQCDSFSQKCTLPFRARAVRPNIWYYTNSSDSRFYEASYDATHNWDAAMRTAIRAAQYAECMNTSSFTGDHKAQQEICVEQWPIYFGQQADNEDAISLSMEMDDCRMGLTQTCNDGSAEKEDIQTCCEAVVDSIGANRKYDDQVIDIAKMDEAFILCHSPVELNDHELCGTADQRLPKDVTAETCQDARKIGDKELMTICQSALNVRKGDLRYHLVNVIETPQTPSPWGIYTSAVDPLTAETISNTVNVWSSPTDFIAQSYVDKMRYAAGELTTEEITEGEYVKDWSQAAESAGRGGSLAPITGKEFDKRISAITGVEGAAKLQLAPGSAAELELQKLKQDFKGVIADSSRASTTSAQYQNTMSSLAGTAVEGSLMNRQMMELYGLDTMGITDGLMDMFSPLRGGNMIMKTEMDRLIQNAMAERGMCMLDFEDAAMIAAPLAMEGLSRVFQAKFGDFNHDDPKEVQKARADKMIDYMTRKLHYSVIVHEMGHSMAHRHNFVGSSDAFNYRPQYWQLRTNNKELSSQNAPTDLDPTGDSILGPRWFDPVNQNEADNLIWMFAHSSVMDYAGDISQDFIGLGAWDIAAQRMFYGDTVAVYPSEYAKVGGSGMEGARAEGAMLKMDNFGGIVGFSEYSITTAISVHYTELDKYYELIQDCENIEDINIFKPSRWDDDVDGAWSPVLDGLIVSIDGGETYSRCHQQDVDYVPWRTLNPVSAEDAPKYSNGEISYMRSTDDDLQYGSMVDKLNRVRVPYGNATDGWADTGNAAVWRHDAGSDPYEIFNFMASQKDVDHIFNYYRRGKVNFTKSGASGRVIGRYLTKMRDGAKGLGLQRNYIRARGQSLGLSPDLYWKYAAENFWSSSVLASTAVFDDMVKTYQRPESGPHLRAERGSSGQYKEDIFRSTEDFGTVNSETELIVPNGAYGLDSDIYKSFAMGGKLLESQLDPKWGEYSSRYEINCGAYYEKIAVSMLMTESKDNFISDSRGDFIDSRYRAVSLADFMPKAYERWLANALTNDEALKGMRIATDALGNPLLDEDGFVSGGLGYIKWYGDQPEVCFPQDGTTVCSAYSGERKINLNDAPEFTGVLESQAGWEIQKFLITNTYMFLPENEKTVWLQKLAMYDTMYPDLVEMPNRMEFHAPVEGKTYIATRYGQEVQFGKTVEKGISARVLQYANELLNKAYETTPIDYDLDGLDDWFELVYTTDSQPIVRYDPTMLGMTGGTTGANCTTTDNSGCICENNRACLELEGYMSIIQWLNAFTGWSEVGTFDWDSVIGIYG